MAIEEFLNEVPQSIYWVFVFLSSFIENVFPPYPGDTVTVFGGYLAGSGRLGLAELIISVFTGSISGAIFMYFTGTKVLAFFSKHVRSKTFQDLVSEEHLNKTHDWFSTYGVWAVLFSRFSAGIRFFVAIVAGMVKMNLMLFTLAFSFGTVVWNALLIYGGYSLGDNWAKVMEYLQVYNWAVGVIILIVIIYFIYRFFRKKNELKSQISDDKN